MAVASGKLFFLIICSRCYLGALISAIIILSCVLRNSQLLDLSGILKGTDKSNSWLVNQSNR